MELSEFVKKNIGKKVDFDKMYGAQCVDLFRQYNQDVWGHPHTGSVEGAKDLFLHYSVLKEKNYLLKFPEDKNSVPKIGSVAIWNATETNPFGHVAIVLGTLNDNLIVFEQDGFKQDGAKIMLRSRENLLGYLEDMPEL